MKTIILYFLLLLNANTYCLAQNSKNRFMIFVNGKAGFIDEKGKIVIPPQFLAAGEFHEGFAVARLKGSYGYINTQGTFVIPPQYDYALSFTEGLAQVYSGEKSYFIDTTGKKIFENEYDKVGAFKYGRAMVTTPTRSQGYIDKTGKLFIDTIYRYTKPFINGRAIVFGAYQPDEFPKGQIMYGAEITGVIDTLGNPIIPLRKFRKIEPFSEGYTRVTLFSTPEDKIMSFAIIDSLGNIVMTRKDKVKIMGQPHAGIIRLQVSDLKNNSNDGNTANVEYMNLNGEIIFSNDYYCEGKDFCENRAFVRHKSSYYSVIDRKGKIIKETFCQKVCEPGFRKGIALVMVNNKWAVIDTNANFLMPPTFEQIDEYSVVDDYFFFKEPIPGDKNERVLYGVAGIDGKVWIKAVLSDYDRSGFHNGLLRGSVNKRLTYFDRQGNIVWQQVEHTGKTVYPLNADYKRHASYSAHSEHTDPNAGGFGGSSNAQRDIKEASSYPAGVLSLRVRTDSKDTLLRNWQGYEVYLVNRTSGEQSFSAQDSGLDMLVQAQDRQGVWRNIEYRPGSWCGNSYHNLILDPNKCWKFTTPVYEGEFKTKLRLVLTLKYINKEPLVLYSNTYSGGVNPGQFWREEEPEYLRSMLNSHTLLPKTFHTLY